MLRAAFIGVIALSLGVAPAALPARARSRRAARTRRVTPKRLRLVALTALLVLVTASVSAQRTRRADPYHAYVIQGRVLDLAGAPVAGAEVERMAAAGGVTPYASHAYVETTDASGAFRFEHAGLGPSVGRTWHLAVHRAGCADAHESVSLDEGRHRGRPADVARGVVIRVPVCP